MKPALRSPAIGTVTTQAYIIFLNKLQSTALCESMGAPDSIASVDDFLFMIFVACPTNTTEPTLQCVVEIGRPILLAIKTVIAAPISIVNPLKIIYKS